MLNEYSVRILFSLSIRNVNVPQFDHHDSNCYAYILQDQIFRGLFPASLQSFQTFSLRTSVVNWLTFLLQMTLDYNQTWKIA